MSGTVIDLAHIDDVLRRFRGREFTTPQFVEVFKTVYPDDWDVLKNRYGEGGAWGGSSYSANNYVGLQLKHRVRRGELEFVRWDSSPSRMGTPGRCSMEGIGTPLRDYKRPNIRVKLASGSGALALDKRRPGSPAAAYAGR